MGDRIIMTIVAVLIVAAPFIAYIWQGKKNKYLGTFATPKEAFYVYKEAKEAYIKEVATKYYNDGKIARNVYEALMNYKVEITD